MAKKWIISFSFVCSGLFSAGQEEKIDTDRPDQTESAGLVPKNYFQAEIGFNKENTYYDNYNLIYPTALLKYGLNKIELRLETVFLSSYEQRVPEPKWTTGLLPVEIGFKALITEEKKIIPKTSIIAHLGIPMLASPSFKIDHAAPSFRLTMQKTINSHLGIGTNFGAAWDGVQTTPLWIYTFSPGFNVGKRWYMYAEVFGFILKNELPQHNLDGGIAYYISNDVKVDISGGFGISEASPKNYFAIGFSFRVNTRGK
jgi:hypothetical protein